jgi:chromosome segregation ATPase
MIKKLIAVAVVGLVGTYFVGETKFGSHIRAWFAHVGNKLEDSVTPETELARIKNEIGQLSGDIDKVKGKLAEEVVTCRLLQPKVEEERKAVKDSEVAVRKHGQVIEAASENSQIEWGNRKMNHATAKEALAAEVKGVNNRKARLKVAERELAGHESNRDLAEQELQQLMKQKDELASEASTIEGEINLAKVEQIRSKYQDDGTRMSEIKSSLAELHKRVMIQREKLQVSENYAKNPAADKSVNEILGGLDEAPVEVKVIDKK